ncbi:hypothetical protein [Mesorhizobium sp. NZP2298]|uniref:hypothetical protein n=1 Tax=Mesorhizobium sp. NZP2298 TaxID=2483403 RepID=UPI0015551A35|nr:hypothetical protein [Mesorhizobium sp. NZP2298]QKC99144.1 hypothetical protein EB231_34700 [Mesorhizobium sp. NZP2298]
MTDIQNAPLPWTHDKAVGYINDANGKHLINCARAVLARSSGMAEFGDRVTVAVNMHEALVTALSEAISHFDTPRMMPPETRAVLDKMHAALDMIPSDGGTPCASLPTLEDAANAARILLLCNGHDLSTWTDDMWPSDDMQEALKSIASHANQPNAQVA